MSREPRRQDPRAKKDMSLARDRRNAYGENSKASRKAIPKRKAWANRANRHAEAQALALGVGVASEDLAENAESRLKAQKPKRWKKFPDVPLATWIETRHKKREYRDSPAYQEYKAQRVEVLRRQSARSYEKYLALKAEEAAQRAASFEATSSTDSGTAGPTDTLGV